jgi:hypothetical protein
MPYTPPTQRSPATSSKASPTITRNHSYEKPPQSPARPDLPRSRSATYIHKHRRAPSLAEQAKQHEKLYDGYGRFVVPSHSDGTSTITTGRPSIPTADVKPILTEGLIASPIEVASSEDDEERGRSRQIADLANTLKSTPMLLVNRKQSPSRREEGNIPLAPSQTPAALSLDTSAAPLTKEARKIIHSRSSSEIVPTAQTQVVIVEDSPGDSDEDGLEMKRGPLLRKKSGELVKPALRASSRKRPLSAPGTPTYPKAVHFNENIEQVRHFLQIDKPSAVSAESSPVEQYESESDFPFVEMARKTRTVEWEIKTNFPADTHERKCLPARLESLKLSPDFKSLIGVVACANISFEKWVTARFTFDYWKTTSEVSAEWANIRFKDQAPDGYDRFQFSIKLSDQANLQNKTLLLCIRYNSGGQEHWDNNFGANFQVDFSRKLPKQWSKTVGSSPASSSPISTSPGIPRSRNNNKASLPRPRSFPVGSSDDEFSTADDSPFRLRGRGASDRRKEPTFTDHSLRHMSNRLSNRYDFNTSLHTALTTAQNALGDRSGLKISFKEPARPVTAPAAAPAAAPPVQPAGSGGPSRPTLGSDEYRDLIQKFCYFGSGGNNTAVTSPEPVDAGATKPEMQAIDGALEPSSESNTSSPGSSTSNSPPSPKVQLHTDRTPPPESRPSNRTPSPSLRAINSPRLNPFRSPSPALNPSSAYQEFPHQGLSVQSAQC